MTDRETPSAMKKPTQRQLLLASKSGQFAGKATALLDDAKAIAMYQPTAALLVRQAAKKLMGASDLLDMERKNG